jgi:hypothetical protein
MPTALLMYGSTTDEASRYSQQQSFALEICAGVLDARVYFQCCSHQGISPNSLVFCFFLHPLLKQIFSIASLAIA